MILSRVRITPQQRLDLEDWLAQQSASRTDSKFYTRELLSRENHIIKSFKVSGIGLKQALIDTTNGSLIAANGSGDVSWFVADDALTQIIVTDSQLEDGQRNYLEIQVNEESNTPAIKAFWDQNSGGGTGSEFNQTVDTITDLAISIVAQTGGFSNSPDRIKLAIVDVDGNGDITGIFDKRELFYRLGTSDNPDNEYTWSSREDSQFLINLTNIVGTFEVDESVSFSSGASATVTSVGVSSIQIKSPDSDSILASATVLGAISGAIAEVLNFAEDFDGADKDISDQKEAFDALATEIKQIKGTDRWFKESKVSLGAGFENAGLSVLAGVGTSSSFSWTGTEFLITDNAGVVDNADIIGYIRRLTRTTNLNLTRQDGQGTSSGIPVSDGQVVWVELPSAGSVSYSDVGTSIGNYRVSNRGDIELNDSVYWLAYREGSRLYLRGLGELEPGESQEINDTLSEALEKYLGFDPETATSVPYSNFPNAGQFGNTFDDQSSLVDAISANTGNINDLGSAIQSNVYDECYKVVDSPTEIDEIAPQPGNSIITLPLDSRDSGNTRFYLVGAGLLQVYVNGQIMKDGVFYQEVGTAGAPSNQIQIAADYELLEDDIITFRLDTLGGFIVTSSGINLIGLQDAYNTGRLIATATGQPVQISGPAGEKLLRVLGDVEITGVLDPQAVEFTRESANPVGALKDGIYVDSNGDLIYSSQGTTLNLSNVASGNGAAVLLEDSYTNNTGSTIAKGTPVRVNPSGTLSLIDVSVEADALAVIGVTSQDISNATEGRVSYSGRLSNISTSITVGQPVYISKIGLLTDIAPSAGANGFVVGDNIVRIGTIVQNKDNPSNKDLLINYIRVGIL